MLFTDKEKIFMKKSLLLLTLAALMSSAQATNYYDPYGPFDSYYNPTTTEQNSNSSQQNQAINASTNQSDSEESADSEADEGIVLNSATLRSNSSQPTPTNAQQTAQLTPLRGHPSDVLSSLDLSMPERSEPLAASRPAFLTPRPTRLQHRPLPKKNELESLKQEMMQFFGKQMNEMKTETDKKLEELSQENAELKKANEELKRANEEMKRKHEEALRRNEEMKSKYEEELRREHEETAKSMEELHKIITEQHDENIRQTEELNAKLASQEKRITTGLGGIKGDSALSGHYTRLQSIDSAFPMPPATNPNLTDAVNAQIAAISSLQQGLKVSRSSTTEIQKKYDALKQGHEELGEQERRFEFRINGNIVGINTHLGRIDTGMMQVRAQIAPLLNLPNDIQAHTTRLDEAETEIQQAKERLDALEQPSTIDQHIDQQTINDINAQLQNHTAWIDYFKAQIQRLQHQNQSQIQGAMGGMGAMGNTGMPQTGAMGGMGAMGNTGMAQTGAMGGMGAMGNTGMTQTGAMGAMGAMPFMQPTNQSVVQNPGQFNGQPNVNVGGWPQFS